MSPTTNIISDGITMPAKLRNLVQAPKPDIRISLLSRKKTYTTLDRIEGVVNVTANTDTPFDQVDIEFVGTSRTYVERLTTAAASSGRSEAYHQFLKLSQPGLGQLCPEDNILRAGQTYEFPFVFAVPQQLLMRVCQHSVHSDAVRDAHYRLPPSFGDKDLNQRAGSWDDMAPDMASVRYGVFAKITKIKSQGDDAFRAIVASKARRLRVIPAAAEQPPLHVDAKDGGYVLRKEKTIRKGMISSKLGSLVMETVQPQALRLISYNNPESRITTTATVNLRFDPIDEKTPPPKLGSLASKLKVYTYFASTARRNFPSKHSSLLDLSQGMHSEQLSLSSRCMTNVEWTKQEPSKASALSTIARRDSATSTSSLHTGNMPKPSAAYKDNAFYTARLLIPITLPSNKAFPPTFHSCLISRIYTVKLDLGIQSPGFGTSMELKVPVQISAEGLVGEECSRSNSIDDSADGEIDAEDVSNFFEPRTIRSPEEVLLGRSRIGSQAPVDPNDDSPPGYSSFAPANTARMAHQQATTVPSY